jgi:hypothetical protein
MVYFKNLVTTNIAAIVDPNWWIDWPDQITWFAKGMNVPAGAPPLRRSKLGHKLPLIRRFQLPRVQKG